MKLLEDDGTLDRLQAERLNGRQIKNLVRTASALALCDEDAEGVIREEHISMALGPMKIFEEDFELETGKTYGMQEDAENPAEDGPVRKRRRIAST